MEEQREATTLGAEVCVSARKVGAGFRKPDDDWQTFLFVAKEGRTCATMHLAVPPVARDNETRDVLFQGVVPMMVKEFGGTAAAIVYSAWIVDRRRVSGLWDEQKLRELHASGVSFETVPGRYEVVCVLAADKDGTICWTAEIERRDAEPPLLGEWEVMEGMDGRLASGLLKGVRP